jgi:hypothetical protein
LAFFLDSLAAAVATGCYTWTMWQLNLTIFG